MQWERHPGITDFIMQMSWQNGNLWQHHFGSRLAVSRVSLPIDGQWLPMTMGGLLTMTNYGVFVPLHSACCVQAALCKAMCERSMGMGKPVHVLGCTSISIHISINNNKHSHNCNCIL